MSTPASLKLLCTATLLVLVAAPAHRAVAEDASGELSAEVSAWLGDNLEPVVALYRELHRWPELSFGEQATSARLAKAWQEMGADVTTEVGGFGVVGVLKNGPGKTLMLRCDLDALPVVEQTGLDYASEVRVKDARGATVGTMHACGHDIHMANLVGTARYLTEHRNCWGGTLLLVAQPAEERGAGAQAMLADGLFQRFPRPDFAVAFHVAADVEAGTLGYRSGYSQANVDSVDIIVKGRGGHGAYPETTIDPIVIAARLVLDLQTIVAREIKPIEPAVVTVGSIHGGTKHNIIGDECRLQLTVRSYSPEVRRQLWAAIRRKADAAAAAAGAPKPVVDISEGTPSLFNDPELVERIATTLKKTFGEAKIVESAPSMGGEDFSRYGQAGVPIAMLKLGSVRADRLAELKRAGPPPSLHSPRYYPDPEETLATGIRAMTTIASMLLPPAAD
ncbi:MAG: amidohydrolase [Planctomycetota bacterium]